MPERDPAKEPERVQMIWFGEELSDNAKAGLRALSQRFPNSRRELVVLPRRRPGDTGRRHVQELMDGYRAEAQEHGVQVRHVRDDTRKLAAGLGPKYNHRSIEDIFNMEMGNAGYIAAKDLTTYLLRGSETGLSLDLSHHHMTDEEWQAVQQDENFSHTAAAPFDFSTAELKVVDLSHGQDANMRNVLNAGFQAMTEQHGDADIEPQMMRHLDTFAIYTREGTRGQEAARTAAVMHMGYLAKMAQDEVLKGNVTFNPRDDDKRFRPDTVNLADDNDLGAKYNTQDPRRADVIGRMNISALADGIHAAFGTPATPPGGTRTDMPTLQVDQATWDDITMRAFQVGNVRVLPQLSLGKDNQGAWRTEPTQDPSDLTNLKGEKITLVQASNMGVSRAAELGMEGLNKPAHLPYTVERSASAGNSPRRTPSPSSSSDESMGRTASDVAALPMPRTPSPESSHLTDAAASTTAARPKVVRAATTLR
ncbi:MULTISPECIES: hypothetical protein [unclassified Streptomyces]|uniref:hypothetical protein n=1 Tax=unclassified Streptomyces TaxID=2593676 RepID=UPI000F502138|nr:MULTISPECIES: hypothetical protein [unclassified Streptomyces]MDH6452442.1 hypothetical protein [Streptomyces sp. SAI-119]MDH6497002.1 hypothetical protein [Streptomyces sp. SAI-149]